MNGSETRPRQLALALSLPEHMGREDFLSAPSNSDALALVERWPDWPGAVQVLVGPPGCGRSHLGAIWAQVSGARRLAAGELTTDAVVEALATGALLLEDVDGRVDATALFHLLNAVRETGGFLLMTAVEPPGAWGFGLADLVSRLRAVPVTMIAAPDDGLLRAVLVKLAHERQLVIDVETVEYCLRRMDRSLAAARDLIAALDIEGIESGRRITRPLAARVLERFSWK